MSKKAVALVFIFGLFGINIYSQENGEQNWFQRHFNNRVYLGYYSILLTKWLLKIYY